MNHKQNALRRIFALSAGIIIASLGNFSYLYGFSKLEDPVVKTYYNVKDYGAAGNNSTIDTDAVNAAISAAQSAGGGVVYFPAGSYRVASVTFGANVAPAFESGAKLVSSGVITVDSYKIHAGNHAIFEGNMSGFANVDCLNVCWFGAIGDGITDASAAIQKAISMQPEGACNHIYIPQGTYYIGATVGFGAKKTLYITGDGAKQSILKIKDGIKGIADDSDPFKVMVVKKIGLTGTDKTASGVELKRCDRMDMMDCYMSGLKTGVSVGGIMGVAGAGSCHFYRNEAENNETVYHIGNYSMFLYYQHLTNRNNKHFLYCNAAESGGISNGIYITDCTSSGGSGEDVFVQNNQTVFFENCVFTDGTGGQAAVSIQNCVDVKIANSTFTSASSARDGIFVNQMYDSHISNNIFSSNRYGINIANQSARAGVHVSGNTFENRTYDMYVGQIRDWKIYNNTFKANVSNPIYRSATSTKTNVVIVENTFTNASVYDLTAVLSLTTSIVEKNTFKQ